MEKILEAFRSYVAPHKDFDLVLSKYGSIYVYPVDRQGELHEAEVLDGPKGIAETIAFQMICDVMESAPKSRTRPTEEELSSVRARIQAFVSGAEFEREVLAFVDSYIEQYKEYEW